MQTTTAGSRPLDTLWHVPRRSPAQLFALAGASRTKLDLARMCA